ncbi:hypothetical protein [Candidatus Viridilinea mediisalina]|uniref:Uncharacterized protein n=1 Tax=Candidatus Viridilinea mediisalina TaxID=2024553 RepID=A0A2A6RLR7_9CHLR|nr:hypothetical protein [Candidatus Viridilinea mediisalina]PDW03851.1 hypothetical protein CJ255_06770 [Candidatus Viridilinea mediisalina]
MGLITYLTTAEAQFGTLAWIFFIAQIVGVGLGAYLYFRHTERNPARYTFMRQLGLAIMLLTGVGVLFGTLRLLDVPTLNMRLWLWGQALIEVVVFGYVVYYMQKVLPKLEREARAKGIKLPQPPPRASRTEAEPVSEPSPPSTTGRRDSRRDRKRKK